MGAGSEARDTRGVDLARPTAAIVAPTRKSLVTRTGVDRSVGVPFLDDYRAEIVGARPTARFAGAPAVFQIDFWKKTLVAIAVGAMLA